MIDEPCVRMAHALRRREVAELPYGCLDPLLAWVSGGRREGVRALTEILGRPGDDLALLRRVYDLLDKALFVQGELFTPIIELSSQPSAETVRQRYRTLVIAFHPDRYAALSGWLTPRSQAINAAYSCWKDPAGHAPYARRVYHAPPPREDRGASGPGDESRYLRGWLEMLRWVQTHLGHVRYLPQKIMAVTLFTCLVPIAYLYYANQAYTDPLSGRMYAGMSGEDGVMGVEVIMAGAPLPPPAAAATVGSAPAPAPVRNVPSGRDTPSPTPPWPKAAAEPATRDAPARMPEPAVAPPQPPAREVSVEAAVPSPPEPEPAGVTAREQAASVAKREMPERAAAGHESAAKKRTAPDTDKKPRTAENDTGRKARSEQARQGKRTQGRSDTTGLPVPAAADAAAAWPPEEDHRPLQLFDASASLARFVSSYRTSFERGDLSGFLRHFSRAARENEHSGLGWLRTAYGNLFRETRWRRLDIDIGKVSQQGGRWGLEGTFSMNLTYPDDRRARASGPIRYTVERDGGAWKIVQVTYRKGQD